MIKISSYLFPIGFIICVDNANFNPNDFYTNGTWEQTSQGRTLVGVDINDTNFNATGKTGGESTHTLTIDQIPAHAHSAWLNNGGGHQHNMWFGGGANSGTGGQIPVANSRWGQDNAGMSTGDHDHGGISVANNGGSQAHNNLQPYTTVYIWKLVSYN